MDLITRAIVAALEAESGDQATVEAYQALKAALRRKFGTDSDLIDAIDKLEKKPESVARRELLKEDIATVQADRDPTLLAAAQTLLDSLKAKIGREYAQPLSPPLQRPARTRHFSGRQEELSQLLASLQPGQVVILSGPGGIGKSALVTEALWKLAPGHIPPDIFPDGMIYHSFYNQPRVDIALEQIARTFAEAPSPTPYDAAQRALAKRQALLVLDGAEQADDLSGVLDVRGQCGILVTSRQELDIPARQQEIAPLPLAEAATLLQAWGGWRARNEAARRGICELVGGLPLSLRLAGQYLAARQEEATEHLTWLEKTALSELEPAQRQQAGLSLLLERSLAQISETARQALAVVGLLALVPFDQEVVAETLTIEANEGLLSAIRNIFKQKSEEEMPDVSRAMGELVNYGLLWPVGRHYQVSHALIHTYARQHLTAPAKATRRLATCYVARVWEQSAQGAEGYVRLDLDRPHFMRVLAECLEWEDWEAAHGLAAALEDYLDLQGYWAERVIANEVGLIAAWQLGRQSEGAWLGNLGDTYRTMGHAKWAIEHFEKALATARQTGDRHSEGNSLGNLGLAYRDLGQVEQARQYLQQSQAIFEEINFPRGATLVREWLVELEKQEK